MGRKKTAAEKERQREFGRRVLSLREEQGLSQDDVMRMGDIERSFISNVENGVHSIASDRLHNLSAGLRVDPVDFFEPEQEAPNGRDAPEAPRYLQFVDYISKEIVSGLLQPGDVLGSESTMCYKYGYSRFAIRKALAVLRGQGLIRTWGQKSFVASLGDLQPLPIGEGDVVLVRMPTPEEAAQHGIAEGVPVLVRKRREDDPDLLGGDEIYQADRFLIKGTG